MPKKKTEKPVKTVVAKTKKIKPEKVSAVDLIRAAMKLDVVKIRQGSTQLGEMRLHAVLKDSVVVTYEQATDLWVHAVWYQELYFELPVAVLTQFGGLN